MPTTTTTLLRATTTTIGKTIVVDHTSNVASIAAVLSAVAAAVAAIILAIIAHRQLAVTRALIGEKGSVKIYAARLDYDVTITDPRFPITHLRPLPERMPYKHVRVVGFHLRNFGPFSHRVKLAGDTAEVGPGFMRHVRVLPAWGSIDAQREVITDYIILLAPRGEDRGTETMLVYLVSNEPWPEMLSDRLRIEFVIGGGERVTFKGEVGLWPMR